jgi:hypothetical protein
MTRDWHKEPSGSFTTDVAAGVIKANTDVKHLEVRGLGQIKGARQPSNGIRVSKYGAATGLTSGKDLGIIDRDINGQVFKVRLVSGLFSDEGDSGAAVLDSDRFFVGMLFAGKSGVPDENYYMHALPDPATCPSTDLFCIRTKNL